MQGTENSPGPCKRGFPSPAIPASPSPHASNGPALTRATRGRSPPRSPYSLSRPSHARALAFDSRPRARAGGRATRQGPAGAQP